MSDTADSRAKAALERLKEHERQCSDCSQAPLPLEDIARALEAGESEIQDRPPVLASAFSERTVFTSALSQRVMLAAAPLLAARSRRAYRTQLVRSVLLTLTPLPVIALFDAYMLHEAYGVLCNWLPGPVVAWILVGYAAMLLLLCALTYAALPLLITPPGAEAKG